MPFLQINSGRSMRGASIYIYIYIYIYVGNDPYSTTTETNVGGMAVEVNSFFPEYEHLPIQKQLYS